MTELLPKYDSQTEILNKIRNEDEVTAYDKESLCQQINRDLQSDDHFEIARIIIINREHHRATSNNQFTMLSLNDLSNRTFWMIRYYVNIVLSGPREKERFETLYRDLLANRQEFDRAVNKKLATASPIKSSNEIPDYRTLMEEALNSRNDFDHEEMRFENMIRLGKEEYPDHFPTPSLF